MNRISYFRVHLSRKTLLPFVYNDRSIAQILLGFLHSLHESADVAVATTVWHIRVWPVHVLEMMNFAPSLRKEIMEIIS